MPKGSVDQLAIGYALNQIVRIEEQKKRLAQKENLISNGRVIPGHDDLIIGNGRRLEAVIMFLDISGFSARSIETAEEQELTLRALNLFFTELVRVAEDYGGVVEKNTGDGLMAYFVKSPDWFQDVRHRAISCAMTMYYGIDNYINPAIVATGIPKIEFRVCLDFGTVTIAKLGVARGFNNIVAVGNTANRTAKMLNKAAPGEILIGDNILNGLPEYLKAHIHLKAEDSGWRYIHSGLPSKLWTFNGRWKGPM